MDAGGAGGRWEGRGGALWKGRDPSELRDSRCNVTCECNNEEINDDEDDGAHLQGTARGREGCGRASRQHPEAEWRDGRCHCRQTPLPQTDIWPHRLVPRRARI